MPDFWDLPRPLRDKIYRMLLVEDRPITEIMHDRRCRSRKPHHIRQTKRMPPLLNVSARADREAAPVYYGENHFIFDDMRVQDFTCQTMPRHIRLVRTITCAWREFASYISVGFQAIGQMKGLQELNIKLDEKELVNRGLRKRDTRQQRYIELDFHTPQEQLAIYLLPGMDAFLSLRGLMRVNFLKLEGRHGNKDFGGPIEGGVLQTQVMPRIMAPRDSKSGKAKGKKSKKSKAGASHFDFLGLPAEIRNRVYDILLKIDGPIHLSKKPASTLAKKSRSADESRAGNSALALLGVNKQIRDEAVGIFYWSPLVFYYPIQFHACVLDLGQLRRSVIRDVTIYYDNVQRGGIDLVDISFPLLRDLTGLRRLHIVMESDLFSKIRARSLYSTGWSMERANPALIPGLKTLFSLRGIADIKVRDKELEAKFQAAQKEAGYPNFEAQSRSYHVVKLTAALEHFNQALQDAQTGSINTELLEDNKWHTWDDFPQLPEEEEVEDEDDDDAGDMTGEEGVAGGEAESAGRGEAIPDGVENTLPAPMGASESVKPTLRRSARLSAKAADLQVEEQPPEDEHHGHEHHEDEHPGIGMEEDIGEEIVVYRPGRGASPEL